MNDLEVSSLFQRKALEFFHLNHNHTQVIMSCYLSADVRTRRMDLTEFVISSKGTVLDPQEIIKELRGRPNLKSLGLSHSTLDNEGSKVLFQWLAYGDDDGSYEGRNDEESCISLPLPQLTNISLTDVSLGNMGLSALIGWLERLKKWQQMNLSISSSEVPDGIRGLSLQNNYIEGTSDLALLFVSALAFHRIEPPYISSSLSYLNLSSNPLSPEFKQALFSSLASLPSLRMLFLSMTGLNQTDAGALAAYIGQCRLTDFNASANNMKYTGLKKILKAMKRCWTLERVDMYANDVEDRGENECESSDDYEGESPENPDLAYICTSGRGWRLLERKLQRILSRNLYLKRLVRDQAFELLRCSRLLLLNPHPDHGQSQSELEELVEQEAPHHSRCNDDCECLPTFHNSHNSHNSHSMTPSPVPIDPPHTSNPHFPFTRLPIEIQLSVLSQMVPILSSSQQIRIFEHAVDKTTLPDLSLRLPFSGGGGTLRSASSTTAQTAFASCETGSFTRPGISARSYVSKGSKHSAQGGGPLAGPHIVTEKQKWLELVGCDAYDPN